MIKGKDLIGKRFGKLLVIEHVSGKAKTKSRFLCQCDCGRKKELSGSYLPYGRALSCGCSRPREAKNNGITIVFNTYRKHARIRGLEFSLNKQLFKELIESACFYCGNRETCRTAVQRSKYHGDRFFIHNGIDRLDNNLGYTEENSVSACKLCNHMKWNLNVQEWKNHMEKVIGKLKENLELAEYIKGVNAASQKIAVTAA